MRKRQLAPFADVDHVLRLAARGAPSGGSRDCGSTETRLWRSARTRLATSMTGSDPRVTAKPSATVAGRGALCALGFAAEFAQDGIASNALWPRTLIATAAVLNLLGGDEAIARARKPELYADAA
jgi:hypothetical protein